ncbi:hypothetical protein [Shimazuella alba]|uniref:Uncharacterized protein n=1 Tax=Shimazuella alba TaxID=2690964 RepID=A0A6I4VWX3_9BACL|nr:hypothetical protein [Shimazuella alba]MXQ54356.1 hypothetical protein [Shimazuella alba]
MRDFATFCREETETVRGWFASHHFPFSISEKDLEVFSQNLSYDKVVLDQFSITTTENLLEIKAVSAGPIATKTWSIQKIKDVVYIFCTLTCYGQKPLKVASKVQMQKHITLSDLGHGW